MKNRILITLCGALLLLQSGCLKEPGHVELNCQQMTVGVNQPVTYTITGADEFTCIEWSSESGPAYTVISGGNNGDITMTCKFTSTGRAGVHVVVKNCKKAGCDGRCNTADATYFLTVQ